MKKAHEYMEEAMRDKEFKDYYAKYGAVYAQINAFIPEKFEYLRGELDDMAQDTFFYPAHKALERIIGEL